MFQRLAARLLAAVLLFTFLTAVPACMGPQRRGGDQQEEKGDKEEKKEKGDKKEGGEEKEGKAEKEGGEKE